jgi:hypothetical protein
VKVKRHDARNYDRSRGRGLRWTDRAGEKHGRLLCLEWVGRWKKRQFWRCQCDCGRIVICRWRNGTLSCGCLGEEAGRMRDFRVQAIDGTWRHARARRIIMPDGRRFETLHELARFAGISESAAHYRVKHWPVERWLEPGMPRGRGEKKHRRRLINEKHKARRTRKPRPWSAANIEIANARRRRERSAPVQQVPDEGQGVRPVREE